MHVEKMGNIREQKEDVSILMSVAQICHGLFTPHYAHTLTMCLFTS